MKDSMKTIQEAAPNFASIRQATLYKESCPLCNNRIRADGISYIDDNKSNSFNFSHENYKLSIDIDSNKIEKISMSRNIEAIHSIGSDIPIFMNWNNSINNGILYISEIFRA